MSEIIAYPSASRGFVNEGLKTSNTDEWETPQELFDRLNRIFCFTIDACATKQNAKCSKYYTKEQDGLKMPWGGGTEYGAIHHMGRRLPSGSQKLQRASRMIRPQ